MGQLVFFSCEAGDGLREEVAGSVRVCVVGECMCECCVCKGRGGVVGVCIPSVCKCTYVSVYTQACVCMCGSPR